MVEQGAMGHALGLELERIIFRRHPRLPNGKNTVVSSQKPHAVQQHPLRLRLLTPALRNGDCNRKKDSLFPAKAQVVR